jgi:hypothetical protein
MIRSSNLNAPKIASGLLIPRQEDIVRNGARVAWPRRERGTAVARYRNTWTATAEPTELLAWLP